MCPSIELKKLNTKNSTYSLTGYGYTGVPVAKHMTNNTIAETEYTMKTYTPALTVLLTAPPITK